jgi:hypothetical protein
VIDGDAPLGQQVLSLLRRSSSAGSYVPDAEQFLTTNDKTRSSITSTIMPALGWLANPTACAAATRTAPLDVAAWLRSRGTIYLLGAEESQVAPLVAALTGHIAREARRIAARSPSGRLDPPLTLVLDDHAEGAGDVSPRKQRVPAGRRGGPRTRPTVPLGLGRWDRFKQSLTCGNTHWRGLGQGC